MRKAVLPAVVVCQRSSFGKKRLSIDSNGTVEMFLPFQNMEEQSLQELNRGEIPQHDRYTASLYGTLKSRKTSSLTKEKEERNVKEKRSSISSEGTIVEDLVLSGGQGLSENMQETEDFSEKNEYLAAATPSAPPIFHNNAESKCKAFQIRNFTDNSENVEIH